jgi:hypothetical protein
VQARKIMLTVVSVNAFLILLFVGTSYAIWSYVTTLVGVVQVVNIGPFWASVSYLGELVNGQLTPISLTPIGPIFNFPFWLFFVSTAV